MITINRATTQDIQGIQDVLAATWRDTYSSFLSESTLVKVTEEWHTPEVIEAELARPSTFSGARPRLPERSSA